MKHETDLQAVEVVAPLVETVVEFTADPALDRKITWHTQRREGARRRAHYLAGVRERAHLMARMIGERHGGFTLNELNELIQELHQCDCTATRHGMMMRQLGQGVITRQFGNL